MGVHSGKLLGLGVKQDWSVCQINKCVHLIVGGHMETNDIIGILAIILAVLLLVFLIRRNRKDQKDFEREMNKSEIKPEKHEDDHV
ncbi:hypothetical protein TH53_09845 [Pedobacter lusitanus]|uniref:Uncharacterized protein n=2 Tax=Pedobacter lusitanus TaxID=1503925 RepID=A0A0D0GJG7_9SPHI|nr:hypothetical protein TH53_09845 [Pedobacter lusitanus]